MSKRAAGDGFQRMGDGSGPEIKSIAHGSWDQESRL